jgi:hypothetical protein
VTRSRSAVAVLLLAAVALAAAAPAAAQCAMCKTVLSGSPEGRAMAGGLNRAILLMIAAPYVVFSIVLAIIFRGHLRAWLAMVAPWLRTRLSRRAAVSA